MTREEKFVLAALVALALGGGVTAIALTRGHRNNNPGNIRRTSDRWLGMADEQPDADYVSFIAPEYGLRALGRILLNYQSRYGIDTVRGFVSRYAPANENDTAAYIASVCTRMNVGPDERIALPAQLGPLMHAIVLHENANRDASRSAYDAASVLLGVPLAA